MVCWHRNRHRHGVQVQGKSLPGTTVAFWWRIAFHPVSMWKICVRSFRQSLENMDLNSESWLLGLFFFLNHCCWVFLFDLFVVWFFLFVCFSASKSIKQWVQWTNNGESWPKAGRRILLTKTQNWGCMNTWNMHNASVARAVCDRSLGSFWTLPLRSAMAAASHCAEQSTVWVRWYVHGSWSNHRPLVALPSQILLPFLSLLRCTVDYTGLQSV